MTDPGTDLSANAWYRRGIFVSLAVCLVILYLMPIGIFRQALSLPDLVYCSVICVVVREPNAAPFWVVVPVLLIGDIFHMRPLGLWTLIVVCIAETVRLAHVFFRTHGFAIEWLAAIIGYVVALGVQQVMMILLFVSVPSFNQLFTMTVLTAAAYPVVAFGWKGLLRHRRPRLDKVDRDRMLR